MNLIGVTSLGHSFPCESVITLFSDAIVGYVQKFGLGTRLRFKMNMLLWLLICIISIASCSLDAVLHCLLLSNLSNRNQLLAT